MAIFQGALPAGEYREAIYFLPLALEHIARDDEEITLCENLLRWVYEERDNLRRDALFDEVMNFFETRFAELVFRFVLDEAGDYPLGLAMAETMIATLNEPSRNISEARKLTNRRRG